MKVSDQLCILRLTIHFIFFYTFLVLLSCTSQKKSEVETLEKLVISTDSKIYEQYIEDYAKYTLTNHLVVHEIMKSINEKLSKTEKEIKAIRLVPEKMKRLEQEIAILHNKNVKKPQKNLCREISKKCQEYCFEYEYYPLRYLKLFPHIIGNKYAVMISVNETRKNQKARLTNKSTKILRKFLEDNEFQIYCHENSDATISKLEKTLREIKKKVKTDDLVLIYFYGHHNSTDFGDDGPYFYLYESDAKNPKTALARKMFSKSLQEIKAENFVFLYDTCHSEALIPGLGLGSSKKYLFLTASRLGDYSYTSKLRGGVFTHDIIYLLRKFYRSGEREYMIDVLENDLDIFRIVRTNMRRKDTAFVRRIKY